MKRILIALLVASLTFALCLSSCASKENDKGEGSDASQTTVGGTTSPDITGGDTTKPDTTELNITKPDATDEITDAPDTEHVHAYSESVVNPTCINKGYTTYTCSCGDTYIDNYTDTVAHTLGEWVTVTAPSAGKTGKAVRKCSVCGAEEEKTLDALPSGSGITVVASPGTIARGNQATVTVKGAPNTEYDITVKIKSGASKAKGLENAVSDANGNVSWTWKISSNTSAGTYTITVEGGGEKIEFEYTITE